MEVTKIEEKTIFQLLILELSTRLITEFTVVIFHKFFKFFCFFSMFKLKQQKITKIFQDYHLQELILNLLYSTTNVFCYSIDKKASAIFKEQMYNLSQCFPNIHIASVEYQVDSAGHNMDRAFLSCMSLIRKIPHWQYAITMQVKILVSNCNFQAHL